MTAGITELHGLSALLRSETKSGEVGSLVRQVLHVDIDELLRDVDT